MLFLIFILLDKMLMIFEAMEIFLGILCGEEAGYLYSQGHEQYWS